MNISKGTSVCLEPNFVGALRLLENAGLDASYKPEGIDYRMVGMEEEPSQEVQNQIYSEAGFYFFTNEGGVVYMAEVGVN